MCLSSAPLPRMEALKSSVLGFGSPLPCATLRGVADPLDLTVYPVPVTRLVGGKEVELERAKIAESAMKSGSAITLKEVLFQDDWLVIVNKPAGLYSEHVLVSVPTLLGHSYSAEYPIRDAEGVLPHLHLANRLDRDTSGVLLVTKSKVAAAKLSQMFESGSVSKTYLALCSGSLPSWRRATITSGHGRSRNGCWRVYSEKDIGRALPKGTVKKMVTTMEVLGLRRNSEFVPLNFGNSGEEVIIVDGAHVPTPAKNTKGEHCSTVEGELCSTVNAQEEEMCSTVNAQEGEGPVARNAQEATAGNAGEAEGRTLRNPEVVIRAFPRTGRTHQIRMHCQYLGLPLSGDVKYGGPLYREGQRLDKHYLHAESIRLKHPITDAELHIVAPQPAWLDSTV